MVKMCGNFGKEVVQRPELTERDPVPAGEKGRDLGSIVPFGCSRLNVWPLRCEEQGRIRAKGAHAWVVGSRYQREGSGQDYRWLFLFSCAAVTTPARIFWNLPRR